MFPLRTCFTDLVGVRVPIVQAPIGSATCPALVAAVSNAGGLGMLAVTWRGVSEIRECIRETKRLTERPFGVNLVLEWPATKRLSVCLEEGVPVVSLFWGDPTPYVPRIHRTGSKVIHSVGTVAEARLALLAGVDAIVAQGWEAGGHVRGEVATFPLLPRVVDAVGPTPVLASGGIADGRGVAAALMLGAAGVWVGTRFLASEEASVDPLYKANIVSAGESDTVRSELFDVGWRNAPHRSLRNSTVVNWVAAGSPPPGSRPGEREIIAKVPSGDGIARYSDVIPVAGATGDLEALALYAGQSVGLVSDIQPAGQIVEEMARDARRTLATSARLLEGKGQTARSPRSKRLRP